MKTIFSTILFGTVLLAQSSHATIYNCKPTKPAPVCNVKPNFSCLPVVKSNCVIPSVNCNPKPPKCDTPKPPICIPPVTPPCKPVVPPVCIPPVKIDCKPPVICPPKCGPKPPTGCPPVPEPASFAALGLGGALLMRKTRSKKS